MLEFQPSRPLTVGVELELQLLNAHSLDLSDGIMSLLEFFPDNECVKAELVQEMVEIATLPCHDLADLEAHLGELLSEVIACAERLELRICGGGSHPFSQRHAAITPKERYLRILDRSAYLARTRVTFATHVHIGLADPEEMIRIKRELVCYLPLLMAVSANSPFWHGCETGYSSYRHRALASASSYGMPPTFGSWQTFQNFFRAASRAEMCNEVKDLHWDIRPQPSLGTVEVRTMDATTTLSEAVALAALIRHLVAYLRKTPPDQRPEILPGELPWWMNRENHFRASRLGLQAECIVDEEGNTRRLGETAEAVFETLAPTAQSLGEARYLERVWRMLERPGYERQLEIYRETGSIEQVSRRLADELASDLPIDRGGDHARRRL